MQRKFIEVTNGPRNWGKFMLLAPDPSDWVYQSAVPEAEGIHLLAGRGWDHHHFILFDLETCEGAAFQPGGSAKADLDKHRIWVCPMFEPLLEWLYAQWRDAYAANPAMSTWVWTKDLPAHVDLPEAEFAVAGYRREGS